MKKFIVVTLFSFLVFFVGSSFADDEVLFGPEKYSRTRGKPKVLTDTFFAKVDQGLRFKLIVSSGDQENLHRVRSAEIRLNGSLVLKPKDFNGSVNRIEVPVALQTDNKISVKLKGIPGSYLTVQVAYDTGPPYSAKIRWTSYGMPHILASDLGSVSFGNGYAFASQNACILADQIIMVRSERSVFFGPDKTSGSGDNANIKSDFFYKAMNVMQLAEDAYEALDPVGKAVVRGYTAGYNKYLSDQGVDNFPCDTRWIKSISEIDLMAAAVDVTFLGGPKPLMNYIVAAQPPVTLTANTSSQKLAIVKADATPPAIIESDSTENGSNAWALGKDLTENGTGMMMGNPHYPWQGERRFWGSHLTVPGAYNVYGASLMGSMYTAIGFTQDVAWSHTVCTSDHFSYYRLQLKPGSPTTYIYDGQEKEMTSREVSIQVKQPDGSQETMTRTYYQSHYGPMIHISPYYLGWGEEYAWTIRSATDGDQGAAQRYAMFTAKNMTEFQKAIADYQSINFVNTIAVDKDGVAWYADTGNVGYVTQAMIDAGCAITGNHQMLDGSRSECEWCEDPDAARPGLVPFKKIPSLTTTTYVSNSNNSYWLTNAEQPITLDIPNQVWGSEESDIGLRPRMGLKMIKDAAGADGKFSWEEFQTVLFNDRVLGAELLLDDLVALCRANDAILSDEVNEACEVLADWDGTCTVDSIGAHIFREFMAFAPPTSELYVNQFDVTDPANTPNTLNTANAGAILEALQNAVDTILDAGVALDAPLGDIQFTWKKDVKIPIHGGGGREGAFNIVRNGSLTSGTLLPQLGGELGGNSSSSFNDQQGYLINGGSSWMLLVEYTNEGPQAKGLLSYSQSTDPASEHYDDQTYLFSQSKWRDLLWTEEDILADPNLRIENITYNPSNNE